MKTLLRAGAAAAVLTVAVLLLPRPELAAALQRLRSLPWYGLAALLLLQTVSLAMIGVQWTLVLRCLSRSGDAAVRQTGPASPAGNRIGWPAVMLRYLGGSLIESITPSAKLGGEAARLVLFGRRFGLCARRLAGAAVTHKVAMLAGLLPAVAAAVVITGSGTVSRLLGIPAAAAALAAAALLPAIAAAIVLLRRGLQRAGAAAPPARLLTGLAAIALLVWLLYPLKVALAARVAGIAVDPAAIVAATFGAYVLGLLPITPGGLGAYEAGMLGILMASGLGAADAAALTLLSRVVTFWWPLLLSAGAGLTLIARGRRPAALTPQLPAHDCSPETRREHDLDLFRFPARRGAA
ncbi:MAG: UPF0104 family protein [Spirochaetaceae bacterium]|nr:MAG: UPF0104 family protein [Spirochaetaceae bacterium]